MLVLVLNLDHVFDFLTDALNVPTPRKLKNCLTAVGIELAKNYKFNALKIDSCSPHL